MNDLNIDVYAESLYRRVNEATLLKRANIDGGDWKPEPNMCHHNVSIWCENNKEYMPVRGWLYFDLPGLNYIKFVAHSAVLAPDGEMYDITPSNASQEYQFLDGKLAEDVYAELVETRGFGEINHIEQKA